MTPFALLHRSVFVSLLAASVSVAAAAAEPQGQGSASALQILTESFPPFNYTDAAGRLTGQSTAVVQALQQRLNAQGPITLQPWAQAYQQALTQPNVMLYSTARTPERESRFQWVGPIGSYQHAFYARADLPQPVRSLEDAKRAGAVAVVAQTARHQFLQQQGFTELVPVASDVEAYRALAQGRVNLVLGSSDSVALAAEQAGLGPFSITEAYPVREVPLYLAFSQGTPSAEAQRWQQALDALKAEGGFQAILAEWGHRLSLVPGTHTGQIRVDADTVAQLLAAYFDAHLASYLAPLQALATTEAVQSAQWAQVQPLLQAREDAAGDARYWFALPDGHYFTTVDGATSGNLLDRGYFAGLLAGEPVEGALVLSRSTGRHAAVVAAPVLRGDTVVGALGASVYLADFAEAVARSVASPTDTWFMAVDGRGLIVLHPDSAWIGQPVSSLAPGLGGVAQRPSGEASFQAEGRHYRAVWATAPLSGWRALVARAVPQASGG